jgi:Leucine-rich repeat (LRR) protein
MEENDYDMVTKRNEKEIIEMQKFFEENIDPNFNPEKIKNLDFAFLNSLKSLNYFHIFKNLKELNIISCELTTDGIEMLTPNVTILRLVSCGIVEISKNFSKLRNLEILSLGENSITEIKNLSCCVRLRKLYLYSNKISKIEFLQDCVLLEELDLSDNQIVKIENLDSLNYLRLINLGANKIEIYNSITHIKYIYSLRELRFYDENYGGNPICQLDEYEYNVFKLNPNIEILDFKKFNKMAQVENGASIFDKFLNKSVKVDCKLKEEKSTVYQELLLLTQFEHEIDNIYKEKVATKVNLYENNDKVNVPKIYMQIERNLEKYKKYLNNSDCNLKDLSTQVSDSFVKQNNLFEIYFDFLIYINNTLYNGDIVDSYTLQIMDFEHICDFYKKFFPENFAEKTGTLPLIILKFNPKGYREESTVITESFIDFNNYSYFVIDDIIKDNFEYILQTVIHDYNRLVGQRNKFFSVIELPKRDMFALLVYRVKDDQIEIKYLIYLFNVTVVSKHCLLQDDIRIEKPTQLVGLINNTDGLEELEIVVNDIEDMETLDEKILKKEKLISMSQKENNDIINEILLKLT